MNRTHTRLITWLAWISVLVFVMLWAARWPSFPLVLDPYYHLMVAQELVQAGGPFTYEWSQYAPVGRPHLYPPALHIVFALFLKLGCSPITIARVASLALPSLLLLSVVVVMRRIATPMLALACGWIWLLPFAFHLHMAMAMAATLGMIELVWLIAALEGKRSVAAGGLFVLLVYTHLGLPVVALVMMGIIAWTRRDLRATVIKASWGLLAALPWWWHLWIHRSSLHLLSRQENAMVELMPVVLGLALIGLWRCWRQGKTGWWALAAAGGFAVLVPAYPYRWMSGEGVFAIVLLAGPGLLWLGEAITKKLRAADRPVTAMALVFLVCAATPTLARTTAGWQWVWPDSGPWHLIAPSTAAIVARDLEGHVYSPQMQHVATRVAALSRPDEIVWSNAAYAGGVLAVLANRATSSAMLNEIPPSRTFDPIAAAHLIVCFKIAPFPGMPDLAALLQRYPVQRVEETELAVIFRNPLAPELAHSPQAAVPFGLAFVLLCAVTSVCVWDLSRRSVVRHG